jgi:hypothetical protein
VRGAADPQVTAIHLREPAINLLVHDNLIRNCGTGLAADTGKARVAEIVDSTTFVCGAGDVPMERRRSHRYQGYSLVWLSRGKYHGPVIVEQFDPETLRFKLHEPAALAAGDLFEVYPPAANWSIHDNTITGCQQPVALDVWGSTTSIFRRNLIDRGPVADVKQPLSLRGRFQIVENHFFGFQQPSGTALPIRPDRLGRPCVNLVRDNVFATGEK